MFLPWQQAVAFSARRPVNTLHFIAYQAPFNAALQPTPLSLGVPPGHFFAA